MGNADPVLTQSFSERVLMFNRAITEALEKYIANFNENPRFKIIYSESRTCSNRPFCKQEYLEYAYAGNDLTNPALSIQIQKISIKREHEVFFRYKNPRGVSIFIHINPEGSTITIDQDLTNGLSYSFNLSSSNVDEAIGAEFKVKSKEKGDRVIEEQLQFYVAERSDLSNIILEPENAERYNNKIKPISFQDVLTLLENVSNLEMSSKLGTILQQSAETMIKS